MIARTLVLLLCPIASQFCLPAGVRAADAARLTGIVRWESNNMALLELPAATQRARHPILQAGETVEGIQAVAIDERTGTVTLVQRKSGDRIDLKLPLTADEHLADRTIHLESAALTQVLEICQRISGRTVIRAPELPAVSLDLKSGTALSREEAMTALEQALAAKGIALLAWGQQFALALPASQTNLLAAIPAPPPWNSTNWIRRQLRWLAPVVPAFSHKLEVFAPGLLKFQDADPVQVLDVHSELSNRTMLRPDFLRGGKITLRSQTPMTRREAVWTLETALFLANVSVAPRGDVFALVTERSRTNPLPQFEAKTALAKARAQRAPETLTLVDIGPEHLLRAYAAWLGRSPVPSERNVLRGRFSLRSRKELTQAEVIYALETLAALQQLRFELVGDDQVKLVPAAARRN